MARSEADLLARRIESQAMISAVPGQMRDLEQIAREVRALGEELERLREVKRRAHEVRDADDFERFDRYDMIRHILGEK